MEENHATQKMILISNTCRQNIPSEKDNGYK
jgi:hypothetical protein